MSKSQIKRIAALGGFQEWNDMTDTQRLVSWREACDEIVALRAEWDALRAAVAAHEADAVAYRAEIERLLDAMEQAEAELSFYGPAEYAGKARKILRDAIETSPSPGTTQEGT